MVRRFLLSLLAKRLYSTEHCFLIYVELDVRENQTPKNLNDEDGVIGVMVKLLEVRLKVNGGGIAEMREFVRGSRLVISLAFEKLILVLFMA